MIGEDVREITVYEEGTKEVECDSCISICGECSYLLERRDEEERERRENIRGGGREGGVSGLYPERCCVCDGVIIE